MAKYKLMVMSKPKPGQEHEYNEWYTNIHVPQVLAVHGFKAAQRCRLTENIAAGEVQPTCTISRPPTSMQ